MPYEIWFRHFNPLTGVFSGFKLSNSQVQLGVYSSTITLNAVTSREGIGGYQVVAGADAELYVPSAFPGYSYPNITSFSTNTAFDTLTVVSPWAGNTVTGVISMSSTTAMGSEMDTGVVFAVNGGLDCRYH